MNNNRRNNNFTHDEMKEIGMTIKNIKTQRATYQFNLEIINNRRKERGLNPLENE